MRVSEDHAVPAAEPAGDPAQEGIVASWREVVDFSDDPPAANAYCLLRDTWWPHPAHGRMEAWRTDDLIVFRCGCGDEVAYPLFLARDLGLIS